MFDGGNVFSIEATFNESDIWNDTVSVSQRKVKE